MGASCIEQEFRGFRQKREIVDHLYRRTIEEGWELGRGPKGLHYNECQPSELMGSRKAWPPCLNVPVWMRGPPRAEAIHHRFVRCYTVSCIKVTSPFGSRRYVNETSFWTG